MNTSARHAPGSTVVGAYRLLAPLGEGGMGVVHLAQGSDGNRVALKVLRPHVVGDAEARERLAREVSSLKRITSPRIAEILDADPYGEVPFVVTRYVPGLSLYHHVAEEGPITGPDLWHFADALAEALVAVHRVGVLHRDIKPTNVLMEGRSPVLIDFGLARVAEDPRLTQTGWLLGTPGYLAPEILYGDDASAASDVHAWAATVVFAATGRPPYGKGPAMAIMDRVRRGEHDLSAVPAPLSQMLRECLAPEPLDRPGLHELRTWIRDLRQATTEAAGAGPEADSETGSWTMPYQQAPLPSSPTEAPTQALPSAAQIEQNSHEQPGSEQARTKEPRTEQARTEQARTEQARTEQARLSSAPTGWPWEPPRESRPQRVLQLLGLGVLTSALVAYAPYLGVTLAGVVVLLLRTVSVTRQRHGRRRLLRGRPRWYDVPVTTLSLPGYLLLALLGALSLGLIAAVSGLAMFSLGYLLGQSVTTSMVLAGLGFAPALWWGPGAERLRETTGGLVARTSRSEFGGWFLAGMCLLAAAVLLGLLLNGGPNWAPAVSAPWV